MVEENTYVKYFLSILWYVHIGEDYTSQIIAVENYSSQSRYRVWQLYFFTGIIWLV